MLRTKAEIDAGLHGITGHGILDPGGRSDPGAGFPWGRFISMVCDRVNGLPTPTEDDDVARLIQTPDGTVWSTDAVRATEVAREIRTGTVGVNDYQLDMNAPFGGVKASGIGRELGPEGLDEFFSLKSIYRVGPA